MRDFRDLRIWKRFIHFAGSVYKITADLPARERFALAVQMNKAAVSIPSNIAEGCGRRTIPDLVQFIHIAIGSSFELETQIEICFLNDYIDIHVYTSLIQEIQELQKMMTGFIKHHKE
jgi:four helix bundle protein